MRSFSAAILMSGLGCLAAVTPAGAEPYSEVTGNWAGASKGGFYFRATLEQNEDKGALKIWNGIKGVPSREGAPEFDAPDFVLSAFAQSQLLEVEEGPDASTLKIVTKYADEVAEGVETISIQYIDNQYTITGYDHQGDEQLENGAHVGYSCIIDFDAGKVTQDGKTRDLPALDFADRNASGWTYDSPYDRGWCARADEPG